MQTKAPLCSTHWGDEGSPRLILPRPLNTVRDIEKVPMYPSPVMECMHDAVGVFLECLVDELRIHHWDGANIATEKVIIQYMALVVQVFRTLNVVFSLARV